MKAIRIRVSALAGMCSKALIGLLGFSAMSCDDNGTVMYGTPYGTLKITGSVETENGQPVENATINVKEITPEDETSVISLASARTNAEGRYMLGSTVFTAATRVNVVCIPADKSLEPDSTVVQLKYSGGDDSWNFGTAEAEVNFRLKSAK